MSTRCLIGKKNETGTISFVYCHHDGYPEYVGEKLKKHYTDEATINKLLALGDMSSLGDKPESEPKLWDFEYSITPEGINKGRTYCNTYKDRGETGVSKKLARNIEIYINKGTDMGAEYLYLFDRGEWFIFDIYKPSTKFETF